MKTKNNTIPVIDLFAGPGGLGEGFSSFMTNEGLMPFKIALSIEKDLYAYQTLILRSFFRQFPPGAAPKEYYDYLRRTGENEEERRKRLFNAFRIEIENAEKTVLCKELGKENIETIRKCIKETLKGYEEFILLGGPPCQAYSIIGRSRNKGNPNYQPKEDEKQRLYVEYLQVIADHRPAIFVMENVKGLLSATLDNQRIFKRILDDLRSPCEAILRENRSPDDRRRKTTYNLFSAGSNSYIDDEDMRRFIIRMERYGIPQARHRIIIIGIRSDIGINQISSLSECEPVEIEDVISDLPRVRSGLSIKEDSLEKWREEVSKICSYPFVRRLGNAEYREICNEMEKCLKSIQNNFITRGGEFIKCKPDTKYKSEWYNDSQIGGIYNHTPKIHMASDLHRYFFAACFAKVHGRSPYLEDFPEELFPEHKNTKNSLKNGHFCDRFHVQIKGRPATTVTSHLSKDGHYFIHPDPRQCRSMTVREVARLQTFPDNYFFCGPRTSQYIQVGNAVPPLLANKIASLVFEIMNKSGMNE